MNKMNNFLGLTLILIALLAGCAPTHASPTQPSYWPTAGWHSAIPEEQGMDSEILAQMVKHIQEEKLALHSLLIVHNGYLVSELYGYPYSAQQVHMTASVTKSVMGALVGIAIQKGEIKNVHQTLFSLLGNPQAANLDESKKAITLEHLLTQTSGLDCHENLSPEEPLMQASQNWVQFMLDLPMAAQPGTKFNYCTDAGELLSAILQKATGMSAREYANQYLFAPLGIEPLSEERWPSDPQSVTIGGFGLTLTPTEMAKLGFLFLNHGQWDGQTVVPAEWVTAVTTSHSNLGERKEYGYLWWIDPQGEWYAALGRSGQHIFVYPVENLVVVFTADLPYTNDADLAPLHALLDDYILPAIKSSSQMPANPDSQTRLEAGIQALAQPERIEPLPLPQTALDITGKTYTLEANPFGWHTLSFYFQDNADEARVTIDDAGQLPIGLDNVYRSPAGTDSPFPECVRGHWENGDTFVVEAVALGQMMESTNRIQFEGDTLHLAWEEKHTSSQIELNGVAQ